MFEKKDSQSISPASNDVATSGWGKKTKKIIVSLLVFSFCLPALAAEEYKQAIDGTRQVKAVLAGKKKTFKAPLDSAVYQTIFNIPESNCQAYATLGDCYNDHIFNRADQKEALTPLINWIKKKIKKSGDRVRVAASLVQNIPYDYDKYNNGDQSGRAHGTRFPYETLYDNAGICGEKAFLMAYLIKELGYGTALISFTSPALHQVAGVKCPAAYDFQDTGYCFIDPNIRHMITFAGSYEDSDPYLIVPIADGKTLNTKNDWKDAQTWWRLIEQGTSSKNNYKSYKKLVKKYGM